MKKLIKRLLGKFYLEEAVRVFIQNLSTAKRTYLWHRYRDFGKHDSVLIEEYFSKNLIRKLHVGCGKNILPDWLNSDFFPESSSVLHLDATEKFPFDDNALDYVFSEHMIEHIPYPSAIFMLNECNRVLKSNGKIRISTPNLQFLIELYNKDKSNLQSEYIRWNTDQFVKYAHGYEDTFVINNYVRDWGHLFIFDEKTLRRAFENAGFMNIRRCEVSQSQDSNLCNLENEPRMPDGFLRLETITLEGEKK